ncbi:zinc finger protein [Macleaya cordata]|uniref:Zinc finger protein n=1 Tax=Macleaya cordata TaxID=56857 RepID=A0A200Q1U4_MACCD|nr:zinc finger protein [Macleaya cordata]
MQDSDYWTIICLPRDNNVEEDCEEFFVLHYKMAAVAARASNSSSSSSNSSSSSTAQISSSGSVQEKGSRNKRKFRTETPIGDLNKLPSSSQIECPSYELSTEKSQNILSHEQHGVCDSCCRKQDHTDIFKPDLRLSGGPGLSEVGSSRPKEELEPEEFQDADWSDLTEGQLEELVLNTLDTIFKSAIKKITASGYSEEVATKAVLRSGLCYGCKDTVTNIVDNTLAFLRSGQEVDPSRDHIFENLEQLEKYILAEMVCVLREVRPFFSTGDAMWCLLICDMNVSLACAMEGDPFSSLGPDENPGCSSSISNPPQLKLEGNSSESQLPNPDKPTPLFPSSNSSEAETRTVAGIPNLPNPKCPVVLEGLPPEKATPIPTSDNKEKSSGISVDRIQTTSQSSAAEEKPVSSGGGRKGHLSTSKRDSVLRQKSIHLDKNYRAYGSKGAMRTGKLSSLGGLVLDKKQKSVSVSESIGVDLKNASLKISKAVGVDLTQTDGNGIRNISTPLSFNPKTGSTPSSLPVANTELSLSLPPKASTTSKPPSSSTGTPNYNFPQIPYDKTLGQLVPDDKKDEMILKLVPRVRELQNQLQEWTEWANQKVMQAARRLSKDKAELKTLRQEKEEVARLKKEKQTLEENTMKKLSEMDYALGKATGQVDRANMAVRRLEVENSELRREMEAAKVRASESAASCQEVSKREKKTLQRFQSWEKQKTLFQEELVTEKRRLAQLQQEVEQAKDLHDQMEARRKQEEMMKEELLAQANSIRKERLQIEATAKSKEDMIRLKAEQDLQRYKEDIRKLESEIAQLRLKNDSSKIAALRRGIDGSYASRLTDGKNVPTAKGTHQIPHISGMMADLNEHPGTGDVKRERECVMCLSEEMSVVFLPCAHQVVCTKCNELHEKQGMKDCPSCRTPIQRRIPVRYARS